MNASGNHKGWLFSLTVLALLTGLAHAQYSIYYSAFGNYSSGNLAGAMPQGAPIQGSDGNFYGTTLEGGTGSCGTVFMLTPQGVLTTLHNFNDGIVASDGQFPTAGLIRDSQGNLYGTTSRGGGTGCYGTAFEISSTGTYSVLHRFNFSTEPNYILSPLVLGIDGNFYGTSSLGASGKSSGCIFKMTPQGAVTTLYQFGSVSKDGSNPGDLMQTSDGNFYGMTFAGGANNLGTIFKVTAGGVETILYSFSSVAFDPTANVAIVPSALILGNDGNLYGGTPGHVSGLYNDGVVFKIPTSGGFVTVANSTSCSSSLLQGADGNFYASTAKGGGGNDVGGIIQMTPQGLVTYLHPWESINFDGYGGKALIQTSDGAFYGFTSSGGMDSYGTAYKLALIPPAFTSSAPPGATIGTSYSFTLTGTGLPSPTFSVTAGSLPPGLTLYAYGGLIGTPTAAGTYTGTVTASNGASPAATQGFSIVVGQAPAITGGPPPATVVLGSTYNFTYQASGYPTPTFTVTTGSLPPGLSLSTTGVLTGAPTQDGTYTGTITASNGVGTAATQNFTITVVDASDSPTMPPWGLMLLAMLLILVSVRSYPSPRRLP